MNPVNSLDRNSLCGLLFQKIRVKLEKMSIVGG